MVYNQGKKFNVVWAKVKIITEASSKRLI
ncbi:hypothetical protein LYNGBM3L_47120 [Moorena producens 3L]|uniref:Uncharacterized protein n=1 Tax=Moorena producens 3L TaxID=489825 RepID=F4XXC3_9CYAN|nr:hypothetical protein LYNGBM3L_47120 [Moorena producens 3L]